MADFEIRHSSASDRLAKVAALPAGMFGTTSDELELFAGSLLSPIGVAVTSPQAPKSGLDVRRLFGVASQGQQDTYTDVSSVVQDASGIKLSPKAHGSPGTDIVTTGYVLPYELADGGTMVIEAVGTYKCGSIMPRILAKLKIGSSYVSPQYEAMMGSTGATAAPTDITVNVADAFEWSYLTCGLNALAGYEALHISAANLTPGEFQWRLTMKVHALGRWAKWSRWDDDASPWLTATGYTAGQYRTNSAGRTWLCTANHTSGASTEPGVGASYTTVWAAASANCWVEATLEWGALQSNSGARMGEPYSYNNPLGKKVLQWSPFVQRDTGTPANGTVRGAIYSHLGKLWLCHAASNSGAQLIAASVTNWADATAYVFNDVREHGGAYYRCIAGHTSVLANDEPGVAANWTLYWIRIYYNADTVTHMLTEEAPGVGLHHAEFFVPAVSRATISGFAAVDWTVGNEIQLELGGPQQVDLGTVFAAYGATTVYAPESGTCSAAGVNYSAKAHMYASAWPRLVAGVETALTTAAPPDARYWRALPTTLRDEMRMQHVHGYLYGRRNGVAERRV